MKAIGFIGYSNSGKTTLIEKLIPIFRSDGLAVSALKNAHHGFDMDRPGKDSFRYRDAGAQQVLIATGSRWALLSETPQRAATLDELLRELAPCDLVIVEGFKSEGNIPRIEVRRTANVDPPIFPHDANVVALATDYPVQTGLPVLDLNDPDKIAAFIKQLLQLPAPRV
ncbi:MAG TPA: molybdopterin-guanine dinucleotide biosynthesis protein B [Burkholderiaceae bacterium]|nr:molybdopterin-guanine dinucleotide biosynthesis protein B [Burkholderiaceae bacterium]